MIVEAVAAGATMTAGAVPATTSAMPRPNILWLVSEDSAFATSPVCAPSRFSIITGVCAESAGPAQHMRAQAELPAHICGFPEYAHMISVNDNGFIPLWRATRTPANPAPTPYAT